MADKLYFVYIMASHTKTLYVGITSDLRKRYREHVEETRPGFTSRYKVKKLVYYEVGNSPQGAIAREKQIKGWLRAKKLALIDSANPDWKDLGPPL